MITATPTVEQELQDLDREIACELPHLRRSQRYIGRRLARVREIGRRAGLLALGTTTFEIYCERAGLSTAEGHQLANAARACESEPAIEQKLQAGKLSVPSVALLARVKDTPAFQREGDDWVAKAETSTTREFRDAVNERKEEARIGEKPTPRTLHLSRKGVTDLVRAKDLLSRKRRDVVSESETVEVALDAYVDRWDPERRAARKRPEGRGAVPARGGTGPSPRPRTTARRSKASLSARPGRDAPNRPPVDSVPRPRAPNGAATPRGAPDARSTPSASDPGLASNTSRASADAPQRSRHIPAAEQHAIIDVSGDRCWVAGCDERAFLDFAHDKPFRWDGPNSRENCGRYCRPHHRLLDAGRMKIRRGRDGPVLVSRSGICVGRIRPRPRPRDPPGDGPPP